MNRILNSRGIIALAQTVRLVCDIDASISDEKVLDIVSTSGGIGSDCALTRLEIDGEIEIPSRLTKTAIPFVLKAPADWFSEIKE